MATNQKKSEKVFIIAEAGVNHNGSVDLAKLLIDAAVEAGVDAVKFQTFKASKLVCKNAKKADYQIESTGKIESQYEMLKKLELDRGTHEVLIDYCKQKNIMFLSTAFDLDSVDTLCELGMDIFKIPSGEITNLPYLRKVGSLGKETIISTGMSNMEEIGEALNVLFNSGLSKDKITVLHCNTEYPTPVEDVNLRAMNAIGRKFDVKIGYSDHTLGTCVSVSAVALGAKLIEKHFTIDKALEGPDHRASLDPEELKRLVTEVRLIEKALGEDVKKPSNSESKNIITARKSIVASCNIRKGSVFTSENLTVKRPATGISPMEWDKVIGQISNSDFEEDEQISISLD